MLGWNSKMCVGVGVCVVVVVDDYDEDGWGTGERGAGASGKSSGLDFCPVALPMDVKLDWNVKLFSTKQ